MEQEQILSYGVDQLVSKLSAWMNKIPVGMWDGKLKDGLYIVVSDISASVRGNPMETLRVTKKAGKRDEAVEIQVPVPRMVRLRLTLVPAFKDRMKALDVSALINRNLHDDPSLDISECNWYGNESGRTLLELSDHGDDSVLPEELRSFLPYCWDVVMELGINSSHEEKVVKVIKRQFTAVNK